MRCEDRDRAEIVRLISRRRWGALATIRDDGTPLASQVAFAPHSRCGSLLLHVSDLAEHTRNMRKRPAVSLVVGDPDPGEGDPQTLPRLSICARATMLAPDDPEHDEAKAAYLVALPDAAPRFSFSDFRLVVLHVREAHFVGGFARAGRIDATLACELIVRAAR